MSEFDGQYTTDWQNTFADRTSNMRSSIIRELLKITQQPGIISFAGGLPAGGLDLGEGLETAAPFLERRPRIGKGRRLSLGEPFGRFPVHDGQAGNPSHEN